MAISPVRTISIRPNGRTTCSNASILSSAPVTSIVIERLDTSMTLPRKMSANCIPGLEVADLDDIDELVQLLGHLVDRVQRTVERQGHPRQQRIVRGTHRERVDVEPAAREKPCNSGQNARLVLHQHRDDVL